MADEREKIRQLAKLKARGDIASSFSEAPKQRSQFRELSASELYCPACKAAMPVRERLPLVLPSGELYDYVCKRCGESLGTKTAANLK